MNRLACMLVLAACGNDRAIQPTVDAGGDVDPLLVTTTPQPGSLDDLHERVIAKRCSGQPGLCHNGQFEPNLSTPGLTYAYLVNRPSIEKPSKLRVEPGSPETSVFIDKIRNRNGVATQMPLGAEPLSEEDTVALERWIEDGALRAPGAAPAPVLNNPPRRPQIGVFSAAGTRLDASGPVIVSPGTTIVLRHTVQDFETIDQAIPFGAVLLGVGPGRNVVLNPGPNDPHVGPTSYDATGPAAQGDIFNYRRSWTVPTTLDVRDDAGTITQMPAAGATLTVVAIYLDGLPANGGMVALDTSPATIQIQ